MAELIETIETQATNPASVASDGLQVSERSIGDLVQADRYVRSSETVKKQKSRGLRFNKISNGSAVGS